MRTAVMGVSVWMVFLQVQRFTKIDECTAIVPEEEGNLSNNADMVFESEECAGKGGIIFFRCPFVEYQLGNDKDGAFHFLLGLQQKFKVSLFSVNKSL